MPGTLTAVRMDKWLWAARFFKTRAIAVKACELGRIVSNGIAAKPARDVRAGDTLQITTATGTFTVQVLALSDQRGPASVAQTLYLESDESKATRARLAEERKAMPVFESALDSRPSKRNRRELERLRGF